MVLLVVQVRLEVLDTPAMRDVQDTLEAQARLDIQEWLEMMVKLEVRDIRVIPEVLASLALPETPVIVELMVKRVVLEVLALPDTPVLKHAELLLK